MNNSLTTLDNTVDHFFLELKTGVRLHYVDNVNKLEKNNCPLTLVFCHGWPEFWFSWRHQLKFFHSLGYRVIALDQRGFGETIPVDRQVSSYSQQKIVEDLVDLFDKLTLQRVVLVGHDWGGMVVWNFSFLNTSRLLGVISLCTPFFPPHPDMNPVDGMKGKFDYQLYFQKEGVAELEFENNMRKTFVCLLRGTDPKDNQNINPVVEINSEKIPLSTATVTKRGGFLVGFPDDLERSSMITEDELNYFIQTFKRSGMRGGLNWYRNREGDWKWSLKTFPTISTTPYKLKPLDLPSLFITAEKDRVLIPEYGDMMKNSGLFNDLQVTLVKNAGHWIQQEQPQDVNKTLQEWIQRKILKSSKI